MSQYRFCFMPSEQACSMPWLIEQFDARGWTVLNRMATEDGALRWVIDIWEPNQ